MIRKSSFAGKRQYIRKPRLPGVMVQKLGRAEMHLSLCKSRGLLATTAAGMHVSCTEGSVDFKDQLKFVFIQNMELVCNMVAENCKVKELFYSHLGNNP